MDTERECGCKGRRTCLLCEKKYNLIPDFVFTDKMRNNSFYYCQKCEKAWKGWDDKDSGSHPNHFGPSLPFQGVFILENFLINSEVDTLLKGIDNEKWDVSQSGRRKQNYGPKCNFKKRKLLKGNFNGFPEFSLFVQKKFFNLPELKDFYVIEQCSLEYDPSKGASIDPHIDDCWIWGERIVTVNVIGDSVLTMIPYKGGNGKYNLDLINSNNITDDDIVDDVVVRIPMPAKSLLILTGNARYNWEHCVLREDINERRVCIAYREFTDPYLPGGCKESLGKDVLEISKKWANTS